MVLTAVVSCHHLIAGVEFIRGASVPLELRLVRRLLIVLRLVLNRIQLRIISTRGELLRRLMVVIFLSFNRWILLLGDLVWVLVNVVILYALSMHRVVLLVWLTSISHVCVAWRILIQPAIVNVREVLWATCVLVSVAARASSVVFVHLVLGKAWRAEDWKIASSKLALRNRCLLLWSAIVRVGPVHEFLTGSLQCIAWVRYSILSLFTHDTSAFYLLPTLLSPFIRSNTSPWVEWHTLTSLILIKFK